MGAPASRPPRTAGEASPPLQLHPLVSPISSLSPGARSRASPRPLGASFGPPRMAARSAACYRLPCSHPAPEWLKPPPALFARRRWQHKRP